MILLLLYYFSFSSGGYLLYVPMGCILKVSKLSKNIPSKYYDSTVSIVLYVYVVCIRILSLMGYDTLVFMMSWVPWLGMESSEWKLANADIAIYTAFLIATHYKMGIPVSLLHVPVVRCTIQYKTHLSRTLNMRHCWTN